MTDYRDAATGFCYRHPNRQSFVLCQRCGRTICPQCQTVAAVGVICPECMREQRAEAPRTTPTLRRRFAIYNASSQPVMTYTLIAVCVAVYILQALTGGSNGIVTRAIWYAGAYSYPELFEPWRLLTSVFAHESILHIGLNMYTLWIFGQVLEPLLGKWRYLTLFLISGVAGSAGVLVLASPVEPVIGASGALFGMMGALLVIQRRLGGPITQLVVLIGINLVISFLPYFGAIAWQAHVGGLVGGLLAGLIFTETRAIRRRRMQVWLLVALAVVMVGIGIYPTLFAWA